MIQLNRLFIEAYSSKEQLIMLRLLLNANDDGLVEFSDRGISYETGIPYQQVRTIHHRWIENGILCNAVNNASTNAKRCFVTICNFDTYNTINVFFNADANAVSNAIKEQEEIKKTDKEIPQTPLQTEKINNQEQEDNSPYNPPSGDENEVLAKFAEMEKAFAELSEENRKLKEENELLRKKKNSNAFVPPTVEEVDAYIKQKGYHFDAETFHSFYTSKGWMVGTNKMKDWKACCRTWESKRKNDIKNNGLPLGMILQGDRETLISEAEEWG